jgi:hypothetical protein
MPSVDVNWWAVFVAALINMAAGAVWYSNALFAKPWTKLTGHKMGEGSAGTGYAVTAVGALVQAWIFVHFVRYAGAITAVKGAVVGFWLWLAFVAIVMATNIVFEGRPWKLWSINSGYFLVVMVVNGALLAAWR